MKSTHKWFTFVALHPALVGNEPLLQFIARLNISIWLVVSTHLKNISQNGNLPQIGVKIQNVWNHHLGIIWDSIPPFIPVGSQIERICLTVLAYLTTRVVVAPCDRYRWPLSRGNGRLSFQHPPTPQKGVGLKKGRWKPSPVWCWKPIIYLFCTFLVPQTYGRVNKRSGMRLFLRGLSFMPWARYKQFAAEKKRTRFPPKNHVGKFTENHIRNTILIS